MENSKAPTRIAVAGAGLIGKRHVAAIFAASGAELAAIVDPTDAAQNYAQNHTDHYYRSLDHMLAHHNPDGIIIATPNQMHVENGLTCINAGIPILVEKPLASNVASAEILVNAAKAANVPVLTGHHRRHNQLIEKARDIINSGKLGEITSVHGQTWLRKPDEYFNVDWRTQPGAGPVFINLIHDIDLMRHLCGEITSVCAMESTVARGNAVEDTAVIILRFANDALGTMNVSDSIVAPWSWELTAKENPAYPATGEICYTIGGTDASLALPNLTIWENPGKKSWMEPISPKTVNHGDDDPLIRQIEHFCEVINGDKPPLVSGLEGLKTLRVIEAIKQSASTNTPVQIQP